ncbi:TolC family protein [Spirulina sp. CCNP1310]|uniref:TolC family protein n=1 Tax=Spirulina sp. CCNP1310 TaxID=3110249 RepID=UPI002B1F0FF1|nr:TolC family protein [Spirulina sp. CCNP1310]MEA5417670.1 TolC family protein [Spirulina sp. CCNP1310]
MLKFRSLVIVSAGAVVALGYAVPVAAQAVFPFRSAPAATPTAVDAEQMEPRPTTAESPSQPAVNPTQPPSTPQPSFLAATEADEFGAVVDKYGKPVSAVAFAPLPPTVQTTAPQRAADPVGEAIIAAQPRPTVAAPVAVADEPGESLAMTVAPATPVEPLNQNPEAIRDSVPIRESAPMAPGPLTNLDPTVAKPKPRAEGEIVRLPEPQGQEAVIPPPEPTLTQREREIPKPQGPEPESTISQSDPFSEDAPLGTMEGDFNEILIQPEVEPTAPSPITPARRQEVPAPDFLNPSGNPLLFPTEADEVTVDITQPITLEQAIALARRNNTTLQTARLNLDRAYAGLDLARAGRLPTVDGTVGLTRESSASGRLQQRQNPLATGDNTTDTLSAQVEVNYDIISGGRIEARIQEAEHQIRLGYLEVERIAEQIRLDATTAYYTLQERDQRVGIEEQSVELGQQTLRDAELLQTAGLGTRFDVIRAQVDLANSEQALTQARANQAIARRELVRVLALGQQVEVTTADEIRPVQPWELSLADTIVLAYRNRAELEQDLLQRDINEQQRRVALAAVRPQVSVFASYNILDRFNDNTGPADGYAIGARLRWRFFDGGAARAQSVQEEIDIELAEVSFEEQRNQIRLEVEQAYENSTANEQNIRTATAAVQLAEESLRLARLRFQAGVGTQTDVITAQTELTRARGNLLTAIITYNRSIAELQRAVSNVPDNRIFDLP